MRRDKFDSLVARSWCFGKGLLIRKCDEGLISEITTDGTTYDDQASRPHFDNDLYDYIYIDSVLDKLGDPIGFCEEKLSLLRKSGRLIISCPNRFVENDVPLVSVNELMEAYMMRRDIQDLKHKSFGPRYYSLNLETTEFIVQAAAKFSEKRMAVLETYDGFTTGEVNTLVSRIMDDDSSNSSSVLNDSFKEIRKDLRSDLNRLSLEILEGKGIVSLNDSNIGKIFRVEDGVMRWILTPAQLDSLGYRNKDLASVLVAESDHGFFGPPLEDGMSERGRAFLSRLGDSALKPGIEISPGSSPILPKGLCQVLYVDKYDHSLVDSYIGQSPTTVDFVLGDKRLAEVLDKGKYFYVISSHVVEHVPDFIGFFESMCEVLTVGGIILLYVPDKRFTFDVLRPETTHEQIAVAYEANRVHATREMAEEVYLLSDFHASSEKLWDASYTPRPSFDREEALRKAREEDLENADLHCWTFTPDSMSKLLDFVIENYLPQLAVREIKQTEFGMGEFVVDLIKNS